MNDIIVEKSYTCNFLPTMLPAINYYRYYSQVDPILRDGKLDRVVFNHPIFDPNDKGRFFEFDLFSDEGRKQIFENWMTKVCHESDVVIMQRMLTQIGLSMIDVLKECNIKIITEIDDSYKIQPYQDAYRNYHPGSEYLEIFKEQLRLSDAIIVTQDKIKEVYSEFGKPVYVVPNGIWFRNEYINKLLNKCKKKPKKGPIKIIWAGSSTHDKDLALIYPELLKVKKALGDKVEIKLIGGINELILKENDGILKQYISLNIFDYYKYLSEENAHIGIAPLCENEFNICKSNLRFLEYSALSMVTVASEVFPFINDIKAGKCYGSNPFHKNKSFSEILINLCNSGIDNIIKEGQEAYKYCKETYDTEVTGKELYNTILSVMK